MTKPDWLVQKENERYAWKPKTCDVCEGFGEFSRRVKCKVGGKIKVTEYHKCTRHKDYETTAESYTCEARKLK